MAYGKQAPTSYSDPEVRKVNQCLARLGKTMVPGTYLVDSYPIMQYIPGYLSELQKYHEEELALFESQLEGVREKMVHPPSRSVLIVNSNMKLSEMEPHSHALLSI